MEKERIQMFTLKSGQQVYGFIDTRSVDAWNGDIKVVQSVGSPENDGIYVGEEFIHLSAIDFARDTSDEERTKIMENLERTKKSSEDAIVRIDTLKTLV